MLASSSVKDPFDRTPLFSFRIPLRGANILVHPCVRQKVPSKNKLKTHTHTNKKDKSKTKCLNTNHPIRHTVRPRIPEKPQETLTCGLTCGLIFRFYFKKARGRGAEGGRWILMDRLGPPTLPSSLETKLPTVFWAKGLTSVSCA